MIESVAVIIMVAWVVLAVVFLPSEMFGFLQGPINRLLRKIGVQQPLKHRDNINNPFQLIIGQQGIVTEAFVNGRGRIHAGNTEWQAQEEDYLGHYQVGDIVKVVGVYSNILLVVSAETRSVQHLLDLNKKKFGR